MNNTLPNERGAALGWSLIALLVSLHIAAVAIGLPGPGEKPESATGLFLMAVMFLILGPLFAVAYFYPHKTFFFRGLMWFAEQMLLPHTRKAAFFFCLLCTFGGLILLAQAFQILNE